LLQFQLSERFPDAQVFMDLDSIEAGLDFADVIAEAVDSCAVLVALIGRQWATLADEAGHRRLDDPDDFVRFEVQAALERGVRVIPVLVDGASPLRLQHLPSELHKLARLNAFELSYGRYQYDAERLIDLIQRVLAEAPGASAVHQSPSAPAGPGPTVPRAEGADLRAARLLTEAEGIAHSLTDEGKKAAALSGIAQALAATDPDHAAQLFTDAERIGQSITDVEKAGALTEVAQALAAIDPDRAERLAHSITHEPAKVSALCGIAKALTATSP
jgi:hypothetical protein